MTEGLVKIKHLYTVLKDVMEFEELVYVLGKINNIEFPISTDGLMRLVEGDVIVGNEVTDDIKASIEAILNGIADEAEIVTNRFTEETKEVYSDIAKLFHSDISKTDIDKYARFCKGDVEAAKVLFTFLNIMPTQSISGNKKWNEAFNAVYSGVTLRRLTVHTGKKFMKLYKKSDAGVLCLSLMLFVKDGVSKDGKCFIRKIDSYFSEWQEWYNTAKEKVKKLNADPISTGLTSSTTNSNGRRTI